MDEIFLVGDILVVKQPMLGCCCGRCFTYTLANTAPDPVLISAGAEGFAVALVTRLLRSEAVVMHHPDDFRLLLGIWKPVKVELSATARVLASLRGWVHTQPLAMEMIAINA